MRLWRARLAYWVWLPSATGRIQGHKRALQASNLSITTQGNDTYDHVCYNDKGIDGDGSDIFFVDGTFIGHYDS